MAIGSRGRPPSIQLLQERVRTKPMIITTKHTVSQIILAGAWAKHTYCFSRLPDHPNELLPTLKTWLRVSGSSGCATGMDYWGLEDDLLLDYIKEYFPNLPFRDN